MARFKVGDRVKAQRSPDVHLTAYARKTPDGRTVYPKGTWHLYQGKRGTVTTYNRDADEHGVKLDGRVESLVWFRPFELVGEQR